MKSHHQHEIKKKYSSAEEMGEGIKQKNGRKKMQNIRVILIKKCVISWHFNKQTMYFWENCKWLPYVCMCVCVSFHVFSLFDIFSSTVISKKENIWMDKQIFRMHSTISNGFKWKWKNIIKLSEVMKLSDR